MFEKVLNVPLQFAGICCTADYFLSTFKYLKYTFQPLMSTFPPIKNVFLPLSRSNELGFSC